MLNTRDLVADDRVNSQFFLQFAPQCASRLLTFFDLSAWEFPLQRHYLVASSLADKYLTSP
jgi:hypothetical protein